MCASMRAVLVFCGVAAFALSTGCSSDSGGRTAESKKSITSLKDTRQELVKAKGEVNDATVALDKLSAGGNGGNLEQSYKQYTVAVKDVQTAGDRAKARAKTMKDNARQYVAKWEKEMEQVSSPELRAGAAERRQRVKDNFEQITASGRAVRDAYDPFLKNLQDIQRALASDLTPDGVHAAHFAIDKAKTQGTALNTQIDGLIANLDEISAGLSGSGTVAPKQASQAGN
jgi:hypothetical protein